MKEKVILISIDGMRPDGFLRCGHPFVKQMLEQFSFCLQARSVVPPVTLPCHTSIFYGMEPDMASSPISTIRRFVRSADWQSSWRQRAASMRLFITGSRCATSGSRAA